VIVVLCPTRNRPQAAYEMAATFRETAVLFATSLVLVVDHDDPELDAYREVPHRLNHSSGVLLPSDPVMVMEVDGGSLTKATNEAAARVWDDDVIIGHVGDDHRFRTLGWDRTIVHALREPGIAYGDDLFQGPVLPTAVFMSAIIPRTLGWYALPGTRHLRIDTAWKDLGAGLDRLHYLPDVIIEHMHPAAGKGERDAGYDVAIEARQEDKEAWLAWRRKRMVRDIRKVAAAC
jgi:hypothetical protein